MREQDILNKIKESADSIEIPESLQPDKIEEMLQKRTKRRFRFQPMHLMAASIALVFMIGLIPLGLGMGGGNDANATGQITTNGSANQGADSMMAGEIIQESVEENEIAKETLVLEKKQDAGDLYQIAESYEEIYEFIENEAVIYYDDYYSIPDGAIADGVIMEEVIAESVATGSAVSSAEKPSASGSTEAPKDLNEAIRNEAALESDQVKLEYSKTNVQVAGVDESDIVKTNGTHIFSVKDDVVTITKVENGKLEKVGTIAPKLASFSDRVLEMYVDGDRLILIVQQAKESLANEPAAWGEGPVTDNIMVDTEAQSTKIAVDVAYNFLTTYNTVLYTYDISNPQRPVEIGRMEQDGNYETSRKIDDIIYLFTYDGFVLDVKNIDKEEEIVELLPKVNGETFSYDSIYLPEQGAQGLVVSSVSLDNPSEIVDKTLVLNNYVNIYVSSSAMYLYNCNYTGNMEVTEIAKFSLEEGRISAVAASSAPGRIQDTFAINEYDGNLRVLTSGRRINGSNDRTNQLYIFDEHLTPAGKIENIAPGESIYAARYFGDLAYFITYRNIDPLFAADLSDIHNPKILGELEITGYSEYLHMWGEDKLLGIGYETDPKTGNNKGIKLVMFDISNPAELAIIDTVVIKDADYSAALYHYKSVLADKNANMIGFTTRAYDKYAVEYQVYSFADGEFKEEIVIDLGKAKNDTDIRGLYIGDYFYIVDNERIGSYYRLEGYKEVSELKL